MKKGNLVIALKGLAKTQKGKVILIEGYREYPILVEFAPFDVYLNGVKREITGNGEWVQKTIADNTQLNHGCFYEWFKEELLESNNIKELNELVDELSDELEGKETKDLIEEMIITTLTITDITKEYKNGNKRNIFSW